MVSVGDQYVASPSFEAYTDPSIHFGVYAFLKAMADYY